MYGYSRLKPIAKTNFVKHAQLEQLRLQSLPKSQSLKSVFNNMNLYSHSQSLKVNPSQWYSHTTTLKVNLSRYNSHTTTLKVNLSHYNSQSQSLTLQPSKSISHSTTLKVNLSQYNSQSQSLTVQLSKSISHSETLKVRKVSPSRWICQSETLTHSQLPKSLKKCMVNVSRGIERNCQKPVLQKWNFSRGQFLKAKLSHKVYGSKVVSHDGMFCHGTFVSPQSLSFINLCRQKMIFSWSYRAPKLRRSLVAVWSQFDRNLPKTK